PASVQARRAGRGLGILTTVVVLAIVGLVLLLFTDLFTSGPRPISIPNVVGVPVTNAENELSAAGFQTERHPVESTTENIDRVITIFPTGQALPRTTIRLDVGAGPAEVEVPNLIGLDRVAAQASLQGVGLVLSPDQRQQVVQDDKDVGHVQVQDPAAGRRLPKGKEAVIPAV